MKKRVPAATESRLSVHVIVVDGPKFLTVDAITWRKDNAFVDLSGVKFVRLQPPEDATDAEIESMRATFGAADIVVTVQSPTRAQVITDQATVKMEDKGARETVEQMVEQANTRDRTALSKLVQEILVEVGL